MTSTVTVTHDSNAYYDHLLAWGLPIIGIAALLVGFSLGPIGLLLGLVVSFLVGSAYCYMTLANSSISVIDADALNDHYEESTHFMVELLYSISPQSRVDLAQETPYSSHVVSARSSIDSSDYDQYQSVSNRP